MTEVIEIGNLSGPQGPPGPAGPQGPAGGTPPFTWVTTKTANYTAAANDYVPVDATSAAVTITLPSAPSAGTRVAVDVIANPAFNNVTVQRGGTDIIGNPAGTTTFRIMTHGAQKWRGVYNAGCWYEEVRSGFASAGNTPFTPAGTIAATNVQNALVELDADIVALGTGGGIPDNAVTNTKLDDMAVNTVKGRVSAGTGDPEDLTAGQVTGLVVSTGPGGTSNFLRADGSWAAPVSTGITSVTISDTPTIDLSGDGTAGNALNGSVKNGSITEAMLAFNVANQNELDAHMTDTTDAHTASAISSSPVGEITATNVQAALADLDSRIDPVGWINGLQVAADMYDEFTGGATLTSPGTVGTLQWAIPTGMPAGALAWTVAAASNGIGVLGHTCTLPESFSGMSLVTGMMELSPVFTCEWRLSPQNLNDGSNNIEFYIGLHNDIPRAVADLVTTNASTTVTSSTAAFSALTDVGKFINTTNLPAGTTISSVTNGTTAVVSNAATATSSAQTASINGPQHGIYWKYSPASTNWRACTSNAGATTNVDTGVVATSGAPYTKLRIQSDGGGNIFFYINGTLCPNMPINTNVPSGTNRYTPAFSMRKTLGSTLRRVNIDYFAMRLEKAR